MSAMGDDPTVHFIRGGRFVCEGEPTAKCHSYPACECEEWTEELHGDTPAPGHEDVQHDECWISPWLGATRLDESYEPADVILDDAEFPDGPVRVEWEADYVLWSYADGTTLGGDS